MDTTPEPALFVVDGDASPEEVAALTAVLQALAAAGTPEPTRRPRSEWASPHRAVRPAPSTVAAGPTGWRSSALPR